MNAKVNIVVPDEAIRGSFLAAIQEVEALNEFYSDFITNWNQNKIELENTYKIDIGFRHQTFWQFDKIVCDHEKNTKYLYIFHL